jgi:hypothetical protein
MLERGWRWSGRKIDEDGGGEGGEVHKTSLQIAS